MARSFAKPKYGKGVRDIRRRSRCGRKCIVCHWPKGMHPRSLKDKADG